jgi:outer membrane protein OmpA-like peptidoglycan-associated protein
MKKVFLFIVLISFYANAQQNFSVYFDFDKYDLNTDAIKKINSWIAEGKKYQVTKLYGFCDWKGTNSYNDTLALKRVNTVYDFLKANKIEVVKSIEIRGFGEDFEQSKVQGENRRVTIMFQEIKEEVDTKSKTEKSIVALTERVKNAKKGDLLKLENFYFFNNSAKMVPKSEPVLYELLCIMNDNPKLKIEIQGHICCKKPTQEDPVSEARAKTVYNYLIRNKINRSRMTYKGYGVSRPIHPIPEKSAQEEDENRRVEILIVDN